MSLEHSGLVIQSTGSWYTVLDDAGSRINCKFKGKYKISGIKATNPIAVGDRVLFVDTEDANVGLITKILPRSNYIVRKSTKLSKVEQIIASNIDICLLMVTINRPRTSSGFIDRYLTCNEAYHIPSALVFNKIDLYDDDDMQRLEELQNIYENAGYKTFRTSVVENIGLDDVINEMKGKTCLFSGHSGVGKSAFIHAIQPELNLKIGDISQVHEKGMHTTTYATMYALSFGGFIIDTPGIKEFGLTGFERSEVAERFPEMRKFQIGCRFNNCMHINEPGCAVIQAVEDGLISEERYNNYLDILQDEYFDVIDYRDKKKLL